jgi:cytosine/adenosine deaminase-related metal-dependent hydrolase
MRAAGVAVALGLNNSAFDEDDDALRPASLFSIYRPDGADRDRHLARGALAAGNGRRSLGLDGAGTLAPESRADLLLLDLDRLDPDRILPIDPAQLVFTRATKAAIAALIVAAAPSSRAAARRRRHGGDRCRGPQPLPGRWPIGQPSWPPGRIWNRGWHAYRDTLGCC